MYDEVCFMIDNPCICNITYNQTQLHCEDGPVIEWRDDASEYSKGYDASDSLAYPEEGSLTRDDASEYSKGCGYGLYYLNGVCVPKEIVMTPSDKLDPMLVVKEENTSVRMEIIKKIGLDRVFDKLPHKIIDEVPSDKYEEKGEYKLYGIQLGVNGEYVPYLWMKNPSTEEYHLEGVHPSCTNIEEALKWRNGREGRPIVLT
jgi:hypothetical protein